jgi:hypothetical protein
LSGKRIEFFVGDAPKQLGGVEGFGNQASRPPLPSYYWDKKTPTRGLIGRNQ